MAQAQAPLKMKPSQPNEVLRFDIEANGYNELTIDKKGTLIREADTVHVMWIQDVFDGSMECYKGDTIVDGVKRLWAAKQIRGHNIIQYDIPVCERVTGLRKPDTCTVDDALIRSRVLWPESYSSPMGGNDLGAWGAYLRSKGRLSAGKGEFHGPWDRWSQEMEDYCKQDVLVYAAIDEYLDTVPQNELVVRIEMQCTQIIARQTANGWTFDRLNGEKMLAELEIEKAGIMDQLAAVFPPEIETMKTYAYYLVRSKSDPTKSRQFPNKGLAEKAVKSLPKDKRDLVEIVPGPFKTKEHPFNPDSGPQCVKRLRAKYGWQPTELTEGGEAKAENGEELTDADYKCDYDVLVKLDYPEAKLLLEYADINKLHEMLIDYVKRATFSRDGKIHGTINVQGCVTGRMSHNQPNMGNVPKAVKDKQGNYVGRSWKIRTLFLPRPGWVEVGGDASALEDRMLRNRLGYYDPKEWEPTGDDLHTRNMNILATVVPTITRDGAKTFWYGTLYGAGDAKAGKIVGAGPDIGKKMKQTFFAKLPALSKLVDYCKAQAKNMKCIKLLDSRVVPCRSQHSALNTQLQGDGACVMKLALLITDTTMKKRGYVPGVDYEFLGNIHDEFQMETRPEIAEETGQLIVWAIGEAGRRLNCKVPIGGEYKIGKCWAETH